MNTSTKTRISKKKLGELIAEKTAKKIKEMDWDKLLKDMPDDLLDFCDDDLPDWVALRISFALEDYEDPSLGDNIIGSMHSFLQSCKDKAGK